MKIRVSSVRPRLVPQYDWEYGIDGLYACLKNRRNCWFDSNCSHEMHDAKVTMNDGQIYCAPLWEFRPKEGFLTLAGIDVSEDAFLKKLYFRDMRSAIDHDRNINGPFQYCILCKARTLGWDGT